jgi:sigma-B regulation protein RsbU (phosphoserine phosphatase)
MSQDPLDDLVPALLFPLALDQDEGSEETTISDADIRRIRSAMAQTGLAMENTDLMARVAAEIAAREKHQRELEIAREVQQRLFPQEYAPVPGLDYAGACRPALEVGGDYYDFIHMSEAALGIAIGDVSGKGIPASLLMATLRAYLRGQTTIRESLPSLMVNLNRFVYDSSPANRYATFFYAQRDASTGALAYVNGGHNAPLLFKAGVQDPMRLDAGGPAIGLLPEAGYVQQQIELDSGDLLVAFTDGISEAMDSAGEEWGEDRLIDVVRMQRALPPGALIEHIMTAVDAFVAGAPQHDDMTLVVIRAR